MSGVIVAPRVRDLPSLAAQLAAWLVRAPVAGGDGYPRGQPLLSLRRRPVARDHFLFDASWSIGGRIEQQGLVVRIKPTTHLV